MFAGILGLSISYIILTIIVLWFVIVIEKHFILRITMIIISIWWGVALYYSVPEMQGWATDKKLPERAMIIYLQIREPDETNEGGIYFWVNEKPEYKQDALNMLDPKKIFIYTGSEQPRAYKIPYDKELHKRLIESKKKQEGTPGGMLELQMLKKLKKRTGEVETMPETQTSMADERNKGKYKDDQIEFKVINPADLFTK